MLKRLLTICTEGVSATPAGRSDFKSSRSSSSSTRERSPYPRSNFQTLGDLEAEILRAERKQTEAESRKRQAMAMLEEAESMEKESVEERRAACNKRVELLERLKAQAIEDSLGSRDLSPLPLPRTSRQPSQVPPIIIDRTNDDLESVTTRSRRRSSAVSPMGRIRQSSSSTASTITENTSISRSSKKAKLRGGGSDHDVLELHRRARPRTIWGGPAWR